MSGSEVRSVASTATPPPRGPGRPARRAPGWAQRRPRRSPCRRDLGAVVSRTDRHRRSPPKPRTPTPAAGPRRARDAVAAKTWPTWSPTTRTSGWAAGSTIVTAAPVVAGGGRRPRSRSTRRRRRRRRAPSVNRSRRASASARVRRVNTPSRSAPGTVEAPWARTSREHQPVVADLAVVEQHHVVGPPDLAGRCAPPASSMSWSA